jgi:membrane protein DedA with SNARE-associated domain
VGYCLLGYFAGGALTQIENSASWLGLALLLAIVVAFVVFFLRKKRRDASTPSP